MNTRETKCLIFSLTGKKTFLNASFYNSWCSRIGDLDIESSIKDQEPKREGKFLVYWLTTTTTSTSTAYTATSTIASLQCTPAGFPYAACG